MFEERAYQLAIAAYFGKLCGHTLFQIFALLQRTARIARTLGMAPYHERNESDVSWCLFVVLVPLI